MPGTIKITDLTALAAASLQADDVLVIVDVHDTTMAPTGTDKKILVSSLFTNPGQFLAANGTVGAPSYAFTNDPDCGLYRIGANNIGFAINGVKLLDYGAAALALTGTLAVSSTSTFTGALTASGGVVGNLTGNVTGNVSGTAPAGSLTGTTLASNVVTSSLTSVGTLAALTVTATITGSVSGNAATATKLQTARTINGVSFDGTANIIVSAATVGTLTFGTYLQAGDASFSGSAATISTNATSANTASTLVARDASGNFAAGTITAALTGNVTGNCSGTSGSTTGNAATATALATARTIWGQSFDGTGNVSGALSGATTGAFSSNVTVGGTLVGSGLITGNAGGSFARSSATVLTVNRGGTDGTIADFQNGGVSNLLVAYNLVTIGTGLTVSAGTTALSSTVTGGTYNGQTISSAASFTGTIAAANVVTVSASGAVVGAQVVINGTGGTNDFAGVQYKVNGTAKWAIGPNASGTGNHLQFYNYNTSSVGLQVDTTTNAAAFAGAINSDSTTDSTSTTTGSIQTDGGLGVAKAGYFGTDVTARHRLGNGSAPGVTTTKTSVSITGTDSYGSVTVTSNVGWSAGDILASVTYAVAFPTHSYPLVTAVGKSGASNPAYGVRNVSTTKFDIIALTTEVTTTATDINYQVGGD